MAYIYKDSDIQSINFNINNIDLKENIDKVLDSKVKELNIESQQNNLAKFNIVDNNNNLNSTISMDKIINYFIKSFNFNCFNQSNILDNCDIVPNKIDIESLDPSYKIESSSNGKYYDTKIIYTVNRPHVQYPIIELYSEVGDLDISSYKILDILDGLNVTNEQFDMCLGYDDQRMFNHKTNMISNLTTLIDVYYYFLILLNLVRRKVRSCFNRY